MRIRGCDLVPCVSCCKDAVMIVGLQKVCMGCASRSQYRLLCLHHYISLAQKSLFGHRCLDNFCADYHLRSQLSFGLTVSTCVLYAGLGCLLQISWPDACTHRRQHMHFCTFVIFDAGTWAHSIYQISAAIVAQDKIHTRRLARSEMLVGSSFKTNLCLAPGLCFLCFVCFVFRVFVRV